MNILLAMSEQPPWGAFGQVLFCAIIIAIVFVPLFAFVAYVSAHDRESDE